MSKDNELDIGAIIRKHQERKDRVSVGREDFVKLETGPAGNIMRLVTFHNAKSGKTELYREYSQHFDIGGKGAVCLKTFGEACPVCEFVNVIKDDAEYRKVANKMFPRKRYIFNVIQGGKLLILEVGTSVWEQIISYFADENYGNISDLKTGRDIKIIKSGTGLSTEYDVKVNPNVKPVKLPSEPKNLYAAGIVYKRSAEDIIEALQSTFTNYNELVNAGHDEDSAESTSSGQEDTTTKLSSEPADEWGSPAPEEDFIDEAIRKKEEKEAAAKKKPVKKGR